MIPVRHILVLGLCLAALAGARAQPADEWVIQPLTDDGWAWLDYEKGLAGGTNGILVQFGGAVLTADSGTVNKKTGEVAADGGVRIQREGQVWVSEHVRYNFLTREIRAEQFRTGEPPFFAAGEGLHADTKEQVFVATNSILTTDDVAQPGVMVRAKYIKIIPGKRITARHATLYIQKVPVFYFPFYTRSLAGRDNNFNFVPGYRSTFGPFLLGSYNWFLAPGVDGIYHLDFRERRGFGTGPDVNLHLGPWGEGAFRYYYLYDIDPNADPANAGGRNDRQRVYLSYLANPAPGIEVRSMARYQGDTNIVREFFEREYRENPQPNTYVEAIKYWQNWSLDAYAQPRLNDFLDTVERLPDVHLTGYRQQLWNLPIYYESETSIGYYQRLFAVTNSLPTGTNYAASRGDTYHELLLPHTFFGWLNLTPRVGERLTYYTESSGPGGIWGQQTRAVFNTGAEITFKASRLWPEAHSSWLDVDGLRHILQPSFNYVFVPQPNTLPHQLPQFDTPLPSLEMLPIEFPEFNAIDAIDSQNAVRLGLANKFQTKRDGTVQDLLNWQLYSDWRLNRSQDLTNRLAQFSDVYSDLALRPRSWLTLESKVRYDVQDHLWRMSLHTLTLQPNEVWNWTVGHLYLHDDLSDSPTALGIGNNLFMSTIFVRFNEDWGFRASHYFEARTGTLQEQAYTFYRDMRSWTAAVTFRERDNPTGPTDYSIAFTFSLKARPRYGVGDESRNPYSLWGGD